MLGTLLGNPGMSQDASFASTATGSGEVKKEGQSTSATWQSNGNSITQQKTLNKQLGQEQPL